MTKETDKAGRTACSMIAACKCIGFLAVLGFTLALTGCSLLHLTGSPPKAQVSAEQLTNTTSGPVSTFVLQAEEFRFADTYVAMVSQSCDDISAKSTNTTLQLAALRWKMDQATAVYNDATGDNPSVNTLDLLVLVTMARNVIEDYGVATYGDAVLPLLNTQKTMESNAWVMAQSVLLPSQQQELKDLIQQWRVKNPKQREVGPVRFRQFAVTLGWTPDQASTGTKSIFSLLYIDPLAGLDPTTATLESIRQMGERGIYYGERMPKLLNWQAQLLAFQLSQQPESQAALADADKLTSAATALAQSGKQLSDNTDRLMRHAFWLGLVLIFIFLTGSVAAGLIYRVLANKLIGRGQDSSKPKS